MQSFALMHYHDESGCPWLLVHPGRRLVCVVTVIVCCSIYQHVSHSCAVWEQPDGPVETMQSSPGICKATTRGLLNVHQERQQLMPCSSAR